MNTKVWNITAIGDRLGLLVTEKFLTDLGFVPMFRTGDRPLYDTKTVDKICERFASLKTKIAPPKPVPLSHFEPRVAPVANKLFGSDDPQNAWYHRTARTCEHAARQYFIGRWGGEFIDIHNDDIEKMAQELYVAAVKEAWRRAPGDDK